MYTGVAMERGVGVGVGVGVRWGNGVAAPGSRVEGASK